MNNEKDFFLRPAIIEYEKNANKNVLIRKITVCALYI
jgi:hypothetical protein